MWVKAAATSVEATTVQTEHLAGQLRELRLDAKTHAWTRQATEDLHDALRDLARECGELRSFYETLSQILSQGQRFMDKAASSKERTELRAAATFWAFQCRTLSDDFDSNSVSLFSVLQPIPTLKTPSYLLCRRTIH